MISKSQPQRPASSARVYDVQTSQNSDSLSERSKIPRLPKRTYSLERKQSSPSSSKTSNSQSQGSNFSLIPRLEWKKNCKKHMSPKSPGPIDLCQKSIHQKGEEDTFILNSSLQNKIQDDFNTFKNNVLRIPEYCEDAEQTLTALLRNSVNIVRKKYPSADVEAFEAEIQSIVQTTEAVKHKIFTKTETIIRQANQIYDNNVKNEKESESFVIDGCTITDVLGNSVNFSNDLLQLEKKLEDKFEPPKMEKRKSDKSKIHGETKDRQLSFFSATTSVVHSCGDAPESPSPLPLSSDSKTSIQTTFLPQNQFTQTINLTTSQLYMQQESLNNLNKSVLDLHRLCIDHMANFKNFNLQIKLRGVCKKPQNQLSKEIQKQMNENLQLTEKNNKLENYNKELEDELRLRDEDIKKKEKLINEQKNLLAVRDHLVEMLKTKWPTDL